MNTRESKIKLFSLGMEELAMALGLINRPDMGRKMITSIYDNLTEEQVESRLSSASHSMLARGLVAISKKGNPILESELERALSPLARFDYVLQLSRVREDKQVGATIHVKKNESFTSHSIQAGVVHVLEHGDYKTLPSYLSDTFGVEDDKTKPISHDWAITPGILGEATKVSDQNAISKVLINNGLPSKNAQDLAEDLAHQTTRGTILRIQANGDIDFENLAHLDKSMLMLLFGKKRDWVFEFNTTADDVRGKAHTIDRSLFQKLLESFAL